jgi:hypothetical protein
MQNKFGRREKRKRVYAEQYRSAFYFALSFLCAKGLIKRSENPVNPPPPQNHGSYN